MEAPHPADSDNDLLARPFAAATRAVVRFPFLTIAGALALAGLSLLLTAWGLGYQTGRTDLVDPESPYHRLWLEYTSEFGDTEDAVVVVEGQGPEQVTPIVDELVQTLGRETRYLSRVLGSIDLEPLERKGLHYLAPSELAGLDHFVGQTVPIAQGAWSRLALRAQFGQFAQRLAGESQSGVGHSPTEAAALGLAYGLVSALRGDGAYHSIWPPLPERQTAEPSGRKYFLSADGRLGMVLVQLAPDSSNSFARGTAAVAALRSRVEEVAQRHPQVRLGVTGMPVMENDEMRASERSTFWASLLSLVGVAVLFVAGFGGLRHAVLANLVLLVGMAWSFGYVTLSIGHLNILSMSFAVTLIGIGIDYGVHYVSRYLQYRRGGWECAPALVETGRTISPAITTGAVTTAVAFFAAGLTSFRGVAELGIIAGGGILLCAAAELLVLPAVLAVVDRSPWGQHLPEPLPIHTWLGPVRRRPGWTLALTLSGTLVLGAGLPLVWYDHNLLNMQPAGLESVAWERKLVSEAGQSVWYAISVAESRNQLLERKAQFQSLPSVERTEEIVSLLPDDNLQVRPFIERIHASLAGLAERPPQVPVDRPEELCAELELVERAMAGRPGGPPLAAILQQARQLAQQLSPSEYFRRVSQYQQQLAEELLARLRQVYASSDPEPPDWNDLPEGLVARFRGRSGKYLLKVYGRGDIWDVDGLERFVKDVRQVDARATGDPLQTYEATREMRRSYELAALYAGVVIAVVLLLDFRRVSYALLAALPLALGMVQMFGILGWLGLALNPANLIALPLILGIGVDYGVHIVHDFREQQGPYRMSSSTAVAVMVDSLTTIVGFGSLMIASHLGLASLGRVLTIGVTCCLFTSFVILPALLTLWTAGRRGPAEPESIQPTVPQRREGAPPKPAMSLRPHRGAPAVGNPTALKLPEGPSISGPPLVEEPALSSGSLGTGPVGSEPAGSEVVGSEVIDAGVPGRAA